MVTSHNDRRFWGTLNNRGRLIIRAPGGTIILRSAREALASRVEGWILADTLSPKPYLKVQGTSYPIMTVLITQVTTALGHLRGLEVGYRYRYNYF